MGRRLVALAKNKTSDADMELDENGRPIIDVEELNLGDNVLIIDPNAPKNGDSEPADDPEQDGATGDEGEPSDMEVGIDQAESEIGGPDENAFID